jgi:hypothetical protein
LDGDQRNERGGTEDEEIRSGEVRTTSTYTKEESKVEMTTIEGRVGVHLHEVRCGLV